jgi:hypothetical protein
MPIWNFAAMAQAGLTGRSRNVARPVAPVVRTVEAVIKAGRTSHRPADAPSASTKPQ